MARTIFFNKMEILAPPCFIKKPEGVKKMYLSPVNIRYVKSQIIYAIHETSTLRVKPEQLAFIENVMHGQDIRPGKQSDLMELHKLNKHIIINTAKQITDEPNMLNENWDKNWGEMPRGNWEYTEYSFRGGIWHPEDLFMESAANRAVPYWKPLEVRFDPRDPNGKYMTHYGYNINPSEIFYRHYDRLENNAEDRRVEIPRRVYY